MKASVTILQCSPHREELQLIIFHLFISMFACKVTRHHLKLFLISNNNDTFKSRQPFGEVLSIMNFLSLYRKCLQDLANSKNNGKALV